MTLPGSSARPRGGLVLVARRHLRQSFLALTSCLLAALLPACGGGDGGGTAPPPDQVPPAVVTDLHATAAAAGQVTLAWTAPGDDGAAGTASLYDLRRVAWPQRDQPWETWQPVAGLPAPASAGTAQSFTAGGLTAGEVYLFRLRARDETLWSDPGNVAVATAAEALDTTAPAAPSDLAVWSSAQTWLTVTWTGVSEDGPYGGAVAGYQVRWAEAPVTDATWDAATPLAVPPEPGPPGARMKATISGLAADRTYHVAVRAADERGNLSPLSASLPAATVRFRTWYVRPDGSGDARTIRAACVDSAQAGDVILVAPGRYTWTSQGDAEPYYGMIYLPRDRTGWTLRGEAGAAATIIDAEGRGRVIFLQGITPGSTSNVTFEGLTITGGNALATAGGDSAGGGFIGHLASPTFRDCVFAGNRALVGGGWAFGGWGAAVLERCLFTANVATSAGGAVGVFNSVPRPVFRECDFLGNEAASAGGAVRAANAAFSLQDCLLARNRAGEMGGAVSCTSVHVSEIVGCTIADNTASLGSAFRIRDTSPDTVSVTRTVIARGHGITTFSFEAGGMRLGCSLLWGNEGGNALPPGVVDLGGNLVADPLFREPGAGDYGVLPGSPCLPENRGADGCGVIGGS